MTELTDPMPRKDVELPPRMPEAATIAELQRALLDARAEIARLRADAQAAVALVIEQAVMDLPKAVGAAATKWCGEKDRETFQSDNEYFRTKWRALPGLRDYVLRALAPADGLAAVEALRKERDAAVSTLAYCEKQWSDTDRIAHAKMLDERSRADRLAADLAAAQQREAERHDPIWVHINMLRGTIAKPTIEQIIHLYGVDALCRALVPMIVREARNEQA